MLLSLERLLGFYDEDVASRYQQDFPYAILSADEARREFLKFVWLFHRHQADLKNNPNDESLNFKCVIHKEMSEIDNFWHTFLLFTKNYHQFCQDYLDGNFFHHVPTKKSDKPLDKEQYAKELELYLSYIYDQLGQDTLITWFPDYFKED